MESENLFLLHSVVLGIYLTFLYDNIRIFRRVIPHNTFVISLEDIIYWVYLAAEVFLLMYRESNGLMRWFSVLGAMAGIFLYEKLFGRYYVYYISRVLQKIRHRIGRIFKTRLKSDNKFLKIRLRKR